MKINSRSIRFRLTAWYACILLAVFAVLAAVLFFEPKRSIVEIVFETQMRRAGQIAEALVPDAERGGDSGLRRSVETIYAPSANSRFIRITSLGGGVLYRSGTPADQEFDPAAVPPAEPWPRHAENRRQPLPDGRALFIAAFPARTASGGAYLVEVGTSAAPIDQMLLSFGLLLGFGLPAVLVIAVGGGYLLVRHSLVPVEEMAGKAEGITQHNLGERLPVAATGDELERLAESLNRMITRLDDAFSSSRRFVADASHELRTPLTVLRGELETLAQDPRIPADAADRLGSLLEEAERLSKIVDRLFALSRLDAGEARAEWVRFDLAELVSTTAGQMSLLADDKRIAVSCSAAQAVWVRGDRARLKQVVVNLLDNAIKYTPEGGSVRMSVFSREGHAVLEVADTGAGIPPEALPHVFERFYRVDESRSRETEGAGLGLAIVKSICNAHGGEVEATSAVARGSCFRVKLPLASEKRALKSLTVP